MALKLLVDTCVWLDLVRDYRQQPVIAAVEDLIAGGQIELLIPQVVIEEFDSNKQRVATDAKRSLRSHFSIVRDAITRFGDENRKDAALKTLEEVDHAAFVKGDAVNDSIERIQTLLASAPTIPTTQAVKARVTDRAIARRAPYHRPKNNVSDAIIIEIYADQITDHGTDFAFVTHNSKDFSREIGDERQPHEHLAGLFDDDTSTYWISLVDLLKTLDEDLLMDHDLEFSGSSQPRRLSEILEAEKLLFKQVWYNRHWNLRTRIERGEHQVVPESSYSRYPYRQDQTLDSVWKLALEAAKRTEDEVGVENLGPWNDFEWGMLNGKLSALRWVLGDEWDMLDT